MRSVPIKRSVDWKLIIAALIYCAAVPYLLKSCLYRISPDAVFYIATAEKYLSEGFSGAVNGYWGPLISWLSLPLLKSGVQPFLAIRLVVFFSGLCSLIAIRLLSSLFIKSEAAKSLILAISVPVAWYFSFTFLTPNLLIAAILLFYLLFISHPDYRHKKRYALSAGLAGALAYFAQGYGFLFFITHFPLFNLFCFIKENRRGRSRIAGKFFIGLAVFFLLSGAWISLLSEKYGQFTVCTGAKFNHLCFVTPDRSAMKEDPMQGLMKPASESMLNAWEDPSFMSLPEWNAFGSTGNFIYQLKAVLKNTLEAVRIFLKFSLFSPFILIGLLILCLARSGKLKTDKYSFLLLAFLVYCGWFMLVMVQERYLIFADFLLILAGFCLLEVFPENKRSAVIWKAGIAILLAISFLYLPASGLKAGFKSTPNSDYALAEKLKALKLQGRIASNKDWTGSLFLAYQLDLKYSGIPRAQGGEKELLNELAEYRVDYFFFWGDKAAVADLFRGRKEITNGEFPGLRIFKLK